MPGQWTVWMVSILPPTASPSAGGWPCQDTTQPPGGRAGGASQYHREGRGILCPDAGTGRRQGGSWARRTRRRRRCSVAHVCPPCATRSTAPAVCRTTAAVVAGARGEGGGGVTDRRGPGRCVAGATTQPAPAVAPQGRARRHPCPARRDSACRSQLARQGSKRVPSCAVVRRPSPLPPHPIPSQPLRLVASPPLPSLAIPSRPLPSPSIPPPSPPLRSPHPLPHPLA